MSCEEQDGILARWKESVGGGESQSQGLSHHMRPSTPRADRAEKQVRRLQKMGEEVTPEAYAAIRGHDCSNHGLIESLHHYCEGETHVPVAYADELIKMIERMQVESATQLDVESRKLRAAVAERHVEPTHPAPTDHQVEDLRNRIEHVEFQLCIVKRKVDKAARDGTSVANSSTPPFKSLWGILSDIFPISNRFKRDEVRRISEPASAWPVDDQVVAEERAHMENTAPEAMQGKSPDEEPPTEDSTKADKGFMDVGITEMGLMYP